MDLSTIGKQQFDLENKFKPFTGKQLFFLLESFLSGVVSADQPWTDRDIWRFGRTDVAILTSPSHLLDKPSKDIAPGHPGILAIFDYFLWPASYLL